MEIPKDLVKQIAHHNCVVFVGAGLSQGAGLPGWKQLLEDMVEDAHNKQKISNNDKDCLMNCIETGQMLMVAEELRELLGDKSFQDSMISKFLEYAPMDIPNCLLFWQN